MLALRLSPNAFTFQISGLYLRYRIRSPQQTRHKSSKPAPPRPQPTPSLFEELFPDEARKSVRTRNASQKDDNEHDVPRLDFNDLVKSLREEDAWFDDEGGPQEVTAAASKQAFRQDNVAILALRAASKSLIESDFRRIAPKGKHIKDWTGPGDILKVIPTRNPDTLEQTNFYFILFPNPAYARTYQNHVLKLHRMAKSYTPTSIESPLPLQKHGILEGENALALLRDYALCPSSQGLQLNSLFPPYTKSIDRLLDYGGYPQITEGEDKTGRAVLFWVVGSQPTTGMVEQELRADGRERGMIWNIAVKLLEPTTKSQESDTMADEQKIADVTEMKPLIRQARKWIITFENENEARRFIRAWHYSPFPSAKGDEPASARTEFLW